MPLHCSFTVRWVKIQVKKLGKPFHLKLDQFALAGVWQSHAINAVLGLLLRMRLMRHVCRGAVPQRHTNQQRSARQAVLLDIIIQNGNVEPEGFAHHSRLELRGGLLASLIRPTH